VLPWEPELRDDKQGVLRGSGVVALVQPGSSAWNELLAVGEPERAGDPGTERHGAWAAASRGVQECSASRHHITSDEGTG
jgi:hypothetical protein